MPREVNGAPLTRYLCALVDVQMGRITLDTVRERWASGDYAGVRPDWAKAYAAQFKR